MTAESRDGTSAPPERKRGSQYRENLAPDYARKMAQAAFRLGDLADLRRMDPDGDRPAVFWRLLAENNLLGHGQRAESMESRWALIIHGIALMTPTSAENTATRTAHDREVPVGRALHEAKYSEMRFNQLLAARDDMLRKLLARTFRMMSTNDKAFDWREMARFILNEGNDEEKAERSRRRLARSYYTAQQRDKKSE